MSVLKSFSTDRSKVVVLINFSTDRCKVVVLKKISTDCLRLGSEKLFY